MGLMTLADFRSDLQAVLGSRQVTQVRLDRWIYFGYVDLAGAIDFEEFHSILPAPTVIGQQIYPVPDGVRVIKGIVGSAGLLQYVEDHEFFRRPPQDGLPVRWTRFGTAYLLGPTPNAVQGINLLAKVDPDPLVAATDVTVLSPVWDQAIYLFSVYHGLIAVGENEAKAREFLGRAFTYVQSRSTHDEEEAREQGLGLTYPMPRVKLAGSLVEGPRAGGSA